MDNSTNSHTKLERTTAQQTPHGSALRLPCPELPSIRLARKNTCAKQTNGSHTEESCVTKTGDDVREENSCPETLDP